MSSLFAFYYATQLLREAGWPRKLGRFKGEGYDAAMVDLAAAQSIEWGAALGAGRPRLALQMMAELYRGSESEDAPDVEAFVEGVKDTWLAADSPHEAVEPSQLATRKATLSVEEFKDPRLRDTMEEKLFRAILWGLSNPDRFEAWYESRLAQHESMLPEMQSAGLEVGELTSLQDMFESSAEIVRELSELQRADTSFDTAVAARDRRAARLARLVKLRGPLVAQTS